MYTFVYYTEISGGENGKANNMDWSNIDDVIELAVKEADDKWGKGLLIATNHPDYDKIIGNIGVDGIEGDPETVYSIASLYNDQFEGGDIEDAILNALSETYLGFF